MQQVNPIAYRPALFLGLGGTGKEVLLRLRRRFYERFRTVNVPFARFLWVDTDTRAVDARGEKLDEVFSAVGFGPEEQCPLLSGDVGTDMGDIFANPEKWSFIHDWLYEEVDRFGRGIKDGAGGIRAVGRLTFFNAFNNLNQVISRRMNELAQLSTIDETQAFFAKNGLPPVNAGSKPDPVVFVVTSVAGGTGCGTFLDTGFLLCDIYRQLKGGNSVQGDFFAYVFLPHVYNECPPSGELAKRSFANAYAALKELDHYTKRIAQASPHAQREKDLSINFNVQWQPHNHRSIQGPPYNAVYLLEMINEGGLALELGRRKDLFSMLAECLFLDLLPGSFADAKRSDYSNIVTRLSGAEGANSVVNGVNLTQMFSRRYAACGLSKIEVPVDSVRGACGATLAVSILRHILRDSEDANVTRNVRDDLASARLDADGIASLYTNEWKDQIRGAVADLFRAREIRKPTDLDTLKADLESLAKRLLGGTGGKPADLTKWLRLRTGGVMEDVRKRTRMLLKDICLENEDRGLMATIRKGGYLELARDQARSLHSPAAEGMPAAFDSLAGGAESQARQLADARDRYIAELDGALTSIPIVLLHAKDVTVRVLGNRIRDYAEQALLVRAEAALMAECKKVAEGLDRELQTWSESLTVLADKFNVACAEAQRMQEEFTGALDARANLLFTRFFSMSDDWPLFYKLGVDPDTGGPGEVDSATEYRRVLATWGAPDGVLDLAGQFRQDTEKALGHKLQRYCEDVFDRDFREHPRAVSLFDRPVFKDPAKRRQALQNLVNRARPMLRQGGLIGTAAAQPPRFAYLGIYTHAQRTPEEQGIIDEIGRIINATAGNQYTLDVHPLDNPYEIYLYFSNYAFAVPSLPAVYGECHNTYTDFYAELMKAPAGSPQASIPLHLSKSWEGKFDDLVVYTDAQARILVEVLSLLLFGSMLRVIHPVDEKQQVVYKYRMGMPLNRLETIGNRRHFISQLMRDDTLRATFLGAVSQREAALTKEQTTSFFWAVTAMLSDPEMVPALPEYKLLSDKLNELLRVALSKGAVESELDSSVYREEERFERIKTAGIYGLEWPIPNQPVLSRDLGDWSKKI